MLIGTSNPRTRASGFDSRLHDHFDLPERPKILVVTLQRLGDVLLATPLVRTLRQGLPGASLDVLVFAGGGASSKATRISIAC